jgi:hypothetical protein
VNPERAAPGRWLRLTALAASAACLLAVVSGASGGAAPHRLLAVLGLPPLVALAAAALALAGGLFYVLVYTRWLKRSTPQNIVIGGAAGAMPPLVGWAAATGKLSLTALALSGSSISSPRPPSGPSSSTSRGSSTSARSPGAQRRCSTIRCSTWRCSSARSAPTRSPRRCELARRLIRPAPTG